MELTEALALTSVSAAPRAPEQQNQEDSVEHALKRLLSLWLETLLSDDCQY